MPDCTQAERLAQATALLRKLSDENTYGIHAANCETGDAIADFLSGLPPEQTALNRTAVKRNAVREIMEAAVQSPENFSNPDLWDFLEENVEEFFNE